MKKVLITGGAGFIGSELVKQLHNDGEFEITVMDDMTEQIHGKNWEDSYLYNSIRDKCRFIKASVLDIDVLSKTIVNNEYIIHLAAETGTGQSMYMINQYNETNIMGLSNVFQVISMAGAKSCVKKIILASSRSVYGEGRYRCENCGIMYPDSRKTERLMAGDYGMYCPICGTHLELLATTEESPVNPKSLYAYTKYAQEMMIKTMCPAMGIDYTIFRFQNVYGKGQSLRNPYTGILSIFSTLMLKNEPVNIFEDGKESRDFIHVSDVARGVAEAVNNNESNGEIINLGSGSNISVFEIATILKEYYNSQSDINITGDFRIGDIAHNKADVTKAENILRFKPKIELKEGIKDFCSWVKSQEISGLDYTESIIEMEQSNMLIRKS